MAIVLVRLVAVMLGRHSKLAAARVPQSLAWTEAQAEKLLALVLEMTLPLEQDLALDLALPLALPSALPLLLKVPLSPVVVLAPELPLVRVMPLTMAL